MFRPAAVNDKAIGACRVRTTDGYGQIDAGKAIPASILR